MVFTEPPIAQSSPNMSRSNIATSSANLNGITLTTDVINKAIVSTGNCDVTSNGNLSGINSQEPNGVKLTDTQTSKMSAMRERNKVKRNVNGVIRIPNFRRTHLTKNVDVIVEESPEELLSISPVNPSNIEVVVDGKNVEELDSASTVSLTSFERHLLGGDEDESQSLSNTSLSSIDKMSISRIDDVMANVYNCDVISINSISSMDITYTADINGQEVKFIESLGKC